MRRSGLLIMLATLIVPGCASLPETLSARPATSGEVPVLRQGEILVFGRILFTENGKSKVPYGLGKPLWQLETPEPASPSEQPAEKRRILPFLSTDRDGAFAYAIPTGHYEIAHAEPLGYTPLLYPGLEFEAREPGLAYYLGDVEVNIDSSIWLGGLWGNYITRIERVEVVDRFDEARNRFAQRLPNPERIRKTLLVPTQARRPHLIEQFVPPIIHR